MDGCHVHEPSAIAYVIQPSLFKTRRGPIRVVTDGPAEGMTIQKVDQRNFLKSYFLEAVQSSLLR